MGAHGMRCCDCLARSLAHLSERSSHRAVASLVMSCLRAEMTASQCGCHMMSDAARAFMRLGSQRNVAFPVFWLCASVTRVAASCAALLVVKVHRPGRTPLLAVYAGSIMELWSYTMLCYALCVIHETVAHRLED